MECRDCNIATIEFRDPSECDPRFTRVRLQIFGNSKSLIEAMVNLPSKLLYVENELDISHPVGRQLQREGFETLFAEDGKTGYEMIHKHQPDLILLDLWIPGLNGFDLCHAIRMDPATRNLPIIIVSASSDETDVVLGLGLGADDYVTKPFSVQELLARVRAVLSRGPFQGGGESANTLRVGNLVIDAKRIKVLREGETIRLTATEFRLLRHLAQYPQKAFSREELLDVVIGETACVIDRNIDVHIRAIRRKIGSPDPIRTIRGFGYRFDPDVLE